MNTVRVGVIGTGFIGPAHIEALRRLPNVKVDAIADVDEATAKAKADALGVEKGFGNYKDLLKDASIDVVHIATPNHLHYPMSKEALEAGKHVVCEKPLAMNTSEAEELVELADKKGLVNAVHFNVRYYPLMNQVRKMIRNDDLGNLFAVHGSYLQDWLFLQTDYNWRMEPEFSGTSRAVADIGSHWMDLVEYVTGLKITEVCADFATFYPIRKKPLKPVETYAGKMLKPEDYADVQINTEDYATVMLHFDNGGHGVFTVNQVAAGRKNRIYYEIDGSKQAVAWESELPNQLWIGKREDANALLLRDPSLAYPESAEIISFPGGHNEGFPDTSKQMFKQIYDAVRSGGTKSPKYPTFKDGLRELVLCDRILESNKKRGWVEV
ncbi:MAG: Gfo/Idh/MocA family protein [Spirochaetia bacterium]